MSSFTVQLSTDASVLEFTPLVYHPYSVETNTVYEWVDVEVVTTNGLFDGGTVETNTVQQQVDSSIITTNEAVWTTTFKKVIPAASQLNVNDYLTASFRRESIVDVELSLTPDDLKSIVGDDLYLLMKQSAQTFGPVPISGDFEAALRTVVLNSIGDAQ